MSSPHYNPRLDILKEPVITKVGNKFIIKPCALEIIWGGDRCFWLLPPTDKPTEPVELVQVSWLQVTGNLLLAKLEKRRYYKLSFKLRLKPDAFGWEGSPVYLMAKPGRSERCVWKKADLSLMSSRTGDTFAVPSNSSALKFRVPKSFEENDTLQFGLYEIWKGSWKGGLAIHEVVIEPVDS